MNLGIFARDNLSLILIATIFLLTFVLASGYLFIAVFSLSIAVACMPLHRRLIRTVPEWVSAGVITTIITGAVVGCSVAAISILLSDLEYLVSMFQDIADTVFRVLGNSGGEVATGGLANTLASMLTTEFPKLVITLAELVPTVIIDTTLFFALLYSFLLLGDRMWGDLWSVLPESSRENIGLMAAKTKDILYTLYIVHVFISILTFFFAYGFFLLLGYGHEMFYAMLCAVFALIPFLGPVLILIFVGLYALCKGDWSCVILICTIGYSLICGVPDLFLRPKLTSKRLQIRPVLVFIGFFGGVMTMGFPGFVLGPVLLVLGITGYEIFLKEIRRMENRYIS
ncbi:MAG: AI-2E family transporter [Methanocalculaceae archaeon]|jgi:predicted PurR-regulated permease PerM|nr:AI-2E family transporter [Methanocalculaceae archaeon]